MTNDEHLDTLHESCKPLFIGFVKECEILGLKPIITSSYRSFEKQYELWIEDNRNAHPGFSMHNYGFAIDANFEFLGEPLKKNTSLNSWIASGIPRIAEKYHLIWGNYQTYKDLVHFQFKGYLASDLLKLKNAQNCEGNKIII